MTVLTWKKAAKRIGELLAADRYLSPAEKAKYPEYRRQEDARIARSKISGEFYSIINDYKDYVTQLGGQDKTVDRWYLSSCADAFNVGDKKMHARTSEGDFILPMMREAMQTIIGENTHLTERCEAVLAELSGPLAAPLEPTYDEMNPPPAPSKEYRLTLGATVYLGMQEYQLLAFDAQTVRLFDPAFPIINKELPREDFDRLLAENPLNDGLLQEVEDVSPAEPAEPDTHGYELGFGHLGNGVTVWNRLELEDGDYKTIAHIAPDRTVTYYEDSLPEDVRAQIEEFAATSTMTISATQDTPVFSTPPLVREPAVAPAEASEPTYPPREFPYIFCEWSESIVFQDETAYSLYEFDRLMKQADEEYVAGKTAAMAKYGTWQKWYDANDPEYNAFLGYDKVKFTLVMPDGRTFTERQDIGDGDGGVLDFLNQYDEYREIVPVLREAVHKEVEAAQSGPTPQPEPGPASGRFWDAYNSIKEHNPDSLVLYQVGDFFELYGGLEGEDAWNAATALDLTLTKRNIPEYGRVSMCGFPAHKLKDYVKKLNSKGFDVIVAALKNNQRVISSFPAQPSEKAKPGTDDFSDIDPAAIRAALAENGIVDGHVVDPDKLDANPFIQQVMADVEQIAANEPPPPERFSVIETEGGYAVWDDIQGGIYVDSEGVQEEFTSEWQAEDYLKQVEKAVADKEVAEWLAVERAKQGTPEPAEKETVTGTVEKGTESLADGRGPDGEGPTLSPPTPRRRAKVSPFVLHPEIPNADRHEYHITDDAIGAGTPGERFNNNVRAIRLLKKLEREDRFATPEEQAVLAQYVGWGGLADCFDERHSKYAELKALLDEDEYAAARESTLTAFYTPPVVIRSIYQALGNMGFKTGNLLEPSCGIGNFIGMRPDDLADSKIYGIELDGISGRIAQQLYQKSSIAVQGFEKTDLPDSFFDAAIGNVPFGSFKVSDKRYDKHNFLIHDYFFARTLDKVRPGGIVAFVTSKGTMDKENPTVRKYIAQRADLLGAIRLPNNTFKDAAGTEVTSDILFLQKREALFSGEPEWVHLNTDANGLKMNQYFIDHPEMVMGDMREVSGPYGPETACLPREGQDLGEQLTAAIQNIQGSITEYVIDDPEAEGEDKSIPADPEVRNFSYTVVDGQVYYRENSRMNPVEVSVTAANRIKGLIGIRDCVRTLIEYQTDDWPAEDIKAEQQKLNALYDAFVEKYGRINSRANSTAFSMDSAYFLLCSLEVLDDERNFVRKADMFTKRTIKQKVVVTSVDTASEALAVSLAEKAKVDMAFMMELTGKTEQEIYADLTGVIFLNPMHGYGNSTEGKYLTADEYLSGNVREKLEWARRSAELYPEDYAANVEALERVQPTDLTASEISVRLGATWLPPDVVEKFIFDLLDTSVYGRGKIHVHYSQYTGGWNVEGKSADRVNVKASSTYGTTRINAYKIIEETLNLRDVRIFDYVEDGDGKKKPVLNKKETAIAQGKQELIKQAFQDWIWKDPKRRERLTRFYNDKFNNLRPREYDGSHINFVGMNPEITLRPHQLNAIAHILYGGNTLLGHVVGAGKTWEMVAAAQESKRLGLCQKSLFVVPNHLTEQWAAEYLQLYPSANILVATKKDFETKNRKRFCGRIATGDYDAIIIGHSQFEKIPMSVERQRYILEQQMDEVIHGLSELKAQNGERFSIKQLERTKKSIKEKLDKLNDQSRKDDVVTFEELGVDRIFIDEAHYYKNLAAFSKMRNVGGISQTEAQKSSDLYMKCRYLDELTGGRGVVFATGTPISNTMVELYTMQKYLQYETLRRNGLLHFDAWASTFGETVTAIELAPEGTGYRAKTRFAKFHNLPELMAMFKEVADIQTADMLKLPVPKAIYHNISLKPSELQKEMVAGLAERAEKVRNKEVDSTVDNMLLITNDGRKLALDQRLLNPILPDSDTSKINACAENVFEIWQNTADQRSTQMVFCDLSTPGKGRPIEMALNEQGTFEMTVFQNVYDDLRDKLIAKGIPAEEIAYIHDANTEAKKKELFGKVRSGQIRVLLGSTQKMGAGTNVQKKLIALHHLDCPWRPSDLQQREGRIIRQKNENDEVDIYTYVTENTFDSYLYQLVEGKQKFIGQIMTSKSPARSVEDIDETALSYAEIKALCTGNPHIKEKMDLDIDVQRLKLLKANHLSQKYSLEDNIVKYFPQAIAIAKGRIKNAQEDIAIRDANTHPNQDGFSPMVVAGVTYTEKKAAGTAILAVCKTLTDSACVPLGQYRGFEMTLSFEPLFKQYKVGLTGAHDHSVTLGTDIFGNIQRLDNLLNDFESDLTSAQNDLATYEAQLASAKIEVEKPFPQEDELKTKSARLDELNILLNMDKRESEIVDGEPGEDTPAPDRDGADRDR
nr:LPD25 domain-containing protein [uncultured Oscillibacter sp.]